MCAWCVCVCACVCVCVCVCMRARVVWLLPALMSRAIHQGKSSVRTPKKEGPMALTATPSVAPAAAAVLLPATATPGDVAVIVDPVAEGLAAKVSEFGDNFSVGQRQVCGCRGCVRARACTVRACARVLCVRG